MLRHPRKILHRSLPRRNRRNPQQPARQRRNLNPTRSLIPDMVDTPDPLPLALRLKDVPQGAFGRELGLAAGDILLAINGRGFTGTPALLAARMDERFGKPLALTFQRGPSTFTVLTDRADLGIWDGVADPETLPEVARLDPDRLSNWEILRSRDGTFDLHRLAPSLLATVLPPLWLLNLRLWVPCATLITAMVVSAAVSPWAAPVVWLASGLHLRHAGRFYLRADRRSRGLHRHSVLAAKSEAEARAAHLQLYPHDHPLFAPVRRTDGDPAEA